jgi:hypothetical protein
MREPDRRRTTYKVRRQAEVIRLPVRPRPVPPVEHPTPAPDVMLQHPTPAPVVRLQHSTHADILSVFVAEAGRGVRRKVLLP